MAWYGVFKLHIHMKYGTTLCILNIRSPPRPPWPPARTPVAIATPFMWLGLGVFTLTKLWFGIWIWIGKSNSDRIG